MYIKGIEGILLACILVEEVPKIANLTYSLIKVNVNYCLYSVVDTLLVLGHLLRIRLQKVERVVHMYYASNCLQC